MTLILALENGGLYETVTVSGYAASMPQVRLGMKKGEEYRLYDLLHSLILESHNDSAVAIAEHIAGSVEDFAVLMNNKALEIGCENTYYITPNGLDAEEEGRAHSTTARDLALVMSYCIKKSVASGEFIKITQTRSYSFSDLSGRRSFSCTNRNAFLDMMDGALSGKTGYTGNAGYCYVGALESDGRTFVVALLACGWPSNKTYKWSDTRALMKYGIENFEYRGFEGLGIPDEVFDELAVTNAATINLERVAYVKPKVTAPIGVEGILAKKEEVINVDINRVYSVEAPVEGKMLIGYVSYSTSDGIWMRRNILIDENVDKISPKWCLERTLKLWFIKK
jgi:D-alanyl-D-alanine carboxypeptidase (penicillin-binding protein 5/6)